MAYFRKENPPMGMRALRDGIGAEWWPIRCVRPVKTTFCGRAQAPAPTYACLENENCDRAGRAES